MKTKNVCDAAKMKTVTIDMFSIFGTKKQSLHFEKIGKFLNHF